MFGKCQSCDAHVAHIESLKAQIEMLSKLAFPNTKSQQVNYAESMEADRILSGNADIIPISEPDYSVDQLLSGTYDNDTERF